MNRPTLSLISTHCRCMISLSALENTFSVMWGALELGHEMGQETCKDTAWRHGKGCKLCRAGTALTHAPLLSAALKTAHTHASPTNLSVLSPRSGCVSLCPLHSIHPLSSLTPREFQQQISVTIVHRRLRKTTSK